MKFERNNNMSFHFRPLPLNKTRTDLRKKFVAGAATVKAQPDEVRASKQLALDKLQLRLKPKLKFKLNSTKRQDHRKHLSSSFNCSLMTIIASCSVLLLILFISLPSVSSFFIDDKQSPDMSEWSYGDQRRWQQMHRQCAGRAQSPIDIQHKNVIISQHLRLHFYNYNQQIKFKLSNAHHTIKMNPIGPTYDDTNGDDQHNRHGGGGGVGGNSRFNSSSIHDMITADEYVEFESSNTNQQQLEKNGGGGGDTSNSLPAAPQAQAQSSQLDKERLLGAAEYSQLPVAYQRQVNLNSNRHNLSKQNNSFSSDKGRQHNSIGNSASDHDHDNQQDTVAGSSSMSARYPNHVEHDSDGQTGGGGGGGGQALASGAVPYEGAPTIKLDWLDDGNNEYKLRDIHFHWGERRDNGSEHAIDGRRAAMEMHLVHIKQGLDKSKISFTSDSVAVIAILIESHRKSNADFNPIVNELARINSTGHARVIDYKSIYDLLPSNLDSFYTYSGSLTTPPCYQVVNWIVMAERLNMNAKQIEMFRSLYAPPTREDDEEARAASSHRADVPAGHFKYKWRVQHGGGGGGGSGGSSPSKVDPYNTKNQSFQSLSESPSGTGGGGGGGTEGSESVEEDADGTDLSSQRTKWLEMIMPNVRSIQELNNRTILASFTKYGSRLQAAMNHSPSVHANYINSNCCLLLLLATNLLAVLMMINCSTPISALVIGGGHQHCRR